MHSVTNVKDKFYEIGGAVTTTTGSTYTVVDTWIYDPSDAKWEQLPDLPVSSGNFQTNGEPSWIGICFS